MRYAAVLRNLFGNLFPSSRRATRGRRRACFAPVEALERRWLLTNFLVTTTLDTVAADGVVSLREAIQAANTNAAVNEAPAGEASGDAITFDASLAGATIVLGGTELAITSELAIDGEDRGITIDANDLSRIFNVNLPFNSSDHITLSNITATHGNSGPVAQLNGGAITIAAGGNVELNGVVVSHSRTKGHGGALAIDESTVSINGCSFFDNVAALFGGAIFIRGRRNIDIASSSITGNSAGLNGGGIESTAHSGSLTIVDSAIDNNSASSSSRWGGGMSLGSANTVIVGGSISNNVAALSGGGVFHNGGPLTIRGTRIDGNHTTGSGSSSFAGGGGILNLSGIVHLESNAEVTNNTSIRGAGIFSNDGYLTVMDSVIHGNVATFSGGGLWNQTGSTILIDCSTISGNAAESIGGGGIFNNGGALRVDSSQVFDNRAHGTAPTGGGIHNGSGGTLEILLSEINGNTAQGSGGGVYNNARLVLDADSRIFENEALAGGGIYNDVSGSLELEDPSAVFSNSPDELAGTQPDFSVLSGWWLINGHAAQILQLNGVLKFVNEFGLTSGGFFNTATEFVASVWGNLLGNLVVNEIQWTNGTTWSRIPDLPSTGTINGSDPVLVQQLGIDLKLTNERGEISSGHFISSTQVVADDWGDLVGTIVDDEIQWENETVWTACDTTVGAAVSVWGAWAFDGQDATILQNGDTLLFVNERGDAAQGAIVDSTHVVATGWGNLGGTIDPLTRRILWDNGTVWDRVPVLDRNQNWHTDDGLPTAVSQLGLRVVITNEFGDRSEGRFDPLRGIVATDFNVIGEIDYDAAAILWDIPFRWNNSPFGARDEAFADANNWPWLV